MFQPQVYKFQMVKNLPAKKKKRERNCLQYERPRFDPWVRKIPWRRNWPPTPVFLPGEFHGQRSLVGYRRVTKKDDGISFPEDD